MKQRMCRNSNGGVGQITWRQMKSDFLSSWLWILMIVCFVSVTLVLWLHVHERSLLLNLHNVTLRDAFGAMPLLTIVAATYTSFIGGWQTSLKVSEMNWICAPFSNVTAASSLLRSRDLTQNKAFCLMQPFFANIFVNTNIYFFGYTVLAEKSRLYSVCRYNYSHGLILTPSGENKTLPMWMQNQLFHLFKIIELFYLPIVPNNNVPWCSK